MLSAYIEKMANGRIPKCIKTTNCPRSDLWEDQGILDCNVITSVTHQFLVINNDMEQIFINESNYFLRNMLIS